MFRMVDNPTGEILENLRSELRRGSLIVAVLAELRQEQYGYTLRKSLEENGISMDEGTLYPLLRRLESQGLLASEWREQDKRNKRFYRLSPQGELILTQLLLDWESLSQSLKAILQQSETGPASESGVPPAEAAPED
ncbi:MAG TPA: PadR family transcriptional regulator [Terriglobales bacterium]